MCTKCPLSVQITWILAHRTEFGLEASISNLAYLFSGAIWSYVPYYSDWYYRFCAQEKANRTKIYMGAISKFLPIISNFNRVRRWTKQIICAKFHLDRVINANCTLFTKIHEQADGRTCINRLRMWFYSDHQKELWVYLVSFCLLQINSQRHNTLTTLWCRV